MGKSKQSFQTLYSYTYLPYSNFIDVYMDVLLSSAI